MQMKTKVVKVVDCSVLKLTGVFSNDEVGWQEGYIIPIWTIGPYFSAIMNLHAASPQSLLPFLLYAATTTCFEFSSRVD